MIREVKESRGGRKETGIGKEASDARKKYRKEVLLNYVSFLFSFVYNHPFFKRVLYSPSRTLSIFITSFIHSLVLSLKISQTFSHKYSRNQTVYIVFPVFTSKKEKKNELNI